MKNFIKDNKNTTILIVISMVAIVLIGFSDMFSKKDKTAETSKQNGEISTEEYITNLENKINNIISQINGAGKCKVMITVKSSSKQEYATDKSISDDVENASDKISERTQRQTEIVMIEDSSGRKKALQIKTTEPEIKGVLVVCEGADMPSVKESLINAITTVLNISSSKVYITKIR